MKNFKRAAAILGVVVLLAVCCLPMIFAFGSGDNAQGNFKAAVGTVILVPVLAYVFLMVYKLLKKEEKEVAGEVKNIIFDVGQVLVSYDWESYLKAFHFSAEEEKLTDLFFTEETPIHTSSPYSSSKASADLLVLAYHRTYGLPVTISRCSNNYGPYHFPEKLIPLMIANALNDKPLPVYGTGENVRDWLYVEDHCRAIDLIIHKGRVGEVYNVGGHNEMTNIDIVKIICKELGKPESLITYVADRKGHDMRYAIDPTKIHNELGWLPETKFADGIKKTIKWYLDNKEWWETIISGEYQNYYEKMYANRGEA